MTDHAPDCQSLLGVSATSTGGQAIYPPCTCAANERARIAELEQALAHYKRLLQERSITLSEIDCHRCGHRRLVHDGGEGESECREIGCGCAGFEGKAGELARLKERVVELEASEEMLLTPDIAITFCCDCGKPFTADQRNEPHDCPEYGSLRALGRVDPKTAEVWAYYRKLADQRAKERAALELVGELPEVELVGDELREVAGDRMRVLTANAAVLLVVAEPELPVSLVMRADEARWLAAALLAAAREVGK